MTTHPFLSRVALLIAFFVIRRCRLFRKIVVSGCLATLGSSFVIAQGLLTPPGAPEPTMKTLDQVEPRKELNQTNAPGDSSALFKITQPGSYYLTTNIAGVAGKHCIVITSGSVTIDLMGFELRGTSNSLDGIHVSSAITNLLIRNGVVSGCGNGYGVDAETAVNALLKDLRLANNAFDGLFVGLGGRIVDCQSSYNGGRGFNLSDGCSIQGCTALGNTNSGILATNGCHISQCTTASNGGSGIVTGSGSSISDCTAQSNGNHGISVGDGSVVMDSTAASNGQINNYAGITAGNDCIVGGCAGTANYNGFFALANCVVRACSAVSNVNVGIQVSSNSVVTDCSTSGGGACIASNGDFVRIEGCNATGSSVAGISLSYSGCLILNNTCNSNGNGGAASGGIVLVNGSRNRIEGNHLSNNNSRGVVVHPASLTNVIVRNSVLTNSVQTIAYDVNAASNDVGPIGKAATATSPWANLQ